MTSGQGHVREVPVEKEYWYSLLSGDDSRDHKGATRVARLIEDAILVEGWPCGEIFASLDELSERYGVGRRVTREAIRILEIRGACQSKRGPGGGLVIANPTTTRVSLTIAVSLLRSGARVCDLMDARRALDGYVLALVSARGVGNKAQAAEIDAPTLPGLTAIQTQLRRHYLRRRSLADMSGNRGLLLFVGCLTELSVGLVLGTPVYGRVDELTRHVEAYDAVIDEILGIDVMLGPEPARSQAMQRATGLALEIDRIVLEAAGADERLDRTVTLFAISVPEGVPSSITLARQVADDILSGKWAPGSRIGSEWDLCEQYGVSQMMLRQTIRLLEEYELVETRPGRSNGVFRSLRFDFVPAIRMCHDLFAAEHLTGNSWWEVLRPIATALAGTAAQRASPEDRLEIRGMLPVLDAMTDMARINAYQRRIMYSVSMSARSAVLEAFWRIISSYRYRAFPMAAAASEPTYGWLSERCRALLETFACEGGDPSQQMYEMLSMPMHSGFRDWVRSPFEQADE